MAPTSFAEPSQCDYADVATVPVFVGHKHELAVGAGREIARSRPLALREYADFRFAAQRVVERQECDACVRQPHRQRLRVRDQQDSLRSLRAQRLESHALELLARVAKDVDARGLRRPGANIDGHQHILAVGGRESLGGMARG